MIFKNINIQKYFNYFLYFCICIPIAIHIKTVYHYALDIPREDDYDAILDVFCKYKVASFYDKISLLFQQQCEHRGLFERLVYVIYYEIFGNINFRHIILFDVFLLIFDFLLLTYFLKKLMPGYWRIPALLLSFGLFDLNNFENADFDGAGLFNYCIILLFLLSMLFYSFQNNKFIIIAATIQALLIYSGGNGMIGAFFLVLYSILINNKIKIIASAIVLLIFSPLYFYHYNFSNPNSIYFTLSISKFMPYFLTSLGANFGTKFTLLIGCLLLLMLLYLAPLNKIRTNANVIPFLCLTGYIVTSLGVMSVFRGNLPIENAYSIRYLIYSHILIVMAFIFLFLKVNSKILRGASVLFLSLIYIKNYNNGLAGFGYFYNCMKTEDYNYPIQGKEHAKQIAEESCRLGIYCIEEHRNDK